MWRSTKSTENFVLVPKFPGQSKEIILKNINPTLLEQSTSIVSTIKILNCALGLERGSILPPLLLPILLPEDNTFSPNTSKGRHRNLTQLVQYNDSSVCLVTDQKEEENRRGKRKYESSLQETREGVADWLILMPSF